MCIYLCAGLTAQESVIKPAQRHKHSTEIVQIHARSQETNKQKTDVVSKSNIKCTRAKALNPEQT
jgi:hypothetical protein